MKDWEKEYELDKEKWRKKLLGAVVKEIDFFLDSPATIVLEKDGRKYKIKSDIFSQGDYLDVQETGE